MLKVLVLDTSRASIYDTANLGAQLSESAALINPAGHMYERELVSDAAGRVAHRGRSGGQSYDPPSTSRAQATQRFARSVAKYLDETLRQDHCEGVVLVAAPRLLGELKRALPRSARDKVLGEIPKDWVQFPPHVIAQQLRNARQERLFDE